MREETGQPGKQHLTAAVQYVELGRGEKFSLL